MNGNAVEVWQEGPPPAPPSWSSRVCRSGRARLRRLRRIWTKDPEPPGAPPGVATGPPFTIASSRPKFEELEAILADSAVLQAIEAAPATPIENTAPPPLRIPHGAALLGRRHRPVPARIVDVFPIGLELDLLELRLLHLHDLVDRFIAIESPRGFGGPRKPLFLRRNLARFDRFRGKLVSLVIDDDAAPSWPSRRRVRTDWRGELAMRNAAWEAARRHLGPDPNTIVLWSDLDEFPSRDVVHWIATHEVDLPLRLRAPTLRYHLGLSDPGIFADIVAFSPSSVGDVPGAALRHLPAPVLRSRGTVHLTSFLPPLSLIAKFALTTDWYPGILPYVRNARGETAGMIAAGQWFGRRLTPYDPEADPEGLVPWAARANRARFARLWVQPGLGIANLHNSGEKPFP